VTRTFNKGDLLIDERLGEIGLLIRRYDVLSCEEYPVWAWDIIWCGPGYDGPSRIQAYTETGLCHMIEVALLKVHKVTEKEI
jgi:hypothetical protein